jgi:hypothetical protein
MFSEMTWREICAKPMKPFDELLNTQDPGWAVVKGWLRDATNHVEVLPPVEANRELALVAIQVTTRSPMGAIIYETVVSSLTMAGYASSVRAASGFLGLCPNGTKVERYRTMAIQLLTYSLPTT